MDGIISTFALTFIPDPGRVIHNGCQALAPGCKWVVLDMAWPSWLPRFLQPALFFLSKWGIIAEVIERRPWWAVWETTERYLVDVERKAFGMGFFYLVWGARPGLNHIP